MEHNQPYPKWMALAQELQAIGQTGCAYSDDVYHRERFERIREIAAEIAATYTGLPIEQVKDAFCNETGYQTPKLDSRAAIFQNGKILLVQENSGQWALPGGWVDVNESIRSNTIKEVWEEAGLQVKPTRLIALQDRNKHNTPPYLHGICKAFVLCKLLGGHFQPNSETIASAYFEKDAPPELALDKTTAEQIHLCFEANSATHWEAVFD